MTAVDAWSRLLVDLAQLIPAPLRRNLGPASIQNWAFRIHDCVQASVAEASRGICGERSEFLGIPNICELPAGHQGFHRAGGCSWGTAA